MALTSTVFERSAPDPTVVDAALAGTRRGVFWLEDPDAPRPALTGAVRADLVVVGGGYTGLWSALRAKERDPSRRVVLLEARSLGWAASGRNGGFVESSLTHGRENGLARWPAEAARLEELGVRNLDDIEATVARYGMDCDFERTGSLAVAVEEYQVGPLADGDGVAGGRFLDTAEVQALVDSPTFLAGLAAPAEQCALVHPGKLVRELARVAEGLGVEIHEDSRVLGLERAGAGVLVRTAGGSVAADQAILGTSAFPSLLARTRLMTVPVYDHVLMTEPLDAAQLASIGWTGREGLSDVANQFHYYRRTADDRILWGGYDAVYHPGGRIRSAYEDRPETDRALAAHFLTTFPQLEGLRFSHRWAGVIDTSTRFAAFYGTALAGRVAYAAGYTGLGVGTTAFAADVLLDLLAGEPTERTELEMVRKRPLPFPPEPFATAGIQATRWSLDRADHDGGRRNPLLRTLDALGLGFDS
ncbi:MULTISPECIES: FAD-binding oxidoreductase [unclassified Rathayibacter]|uniref:NAD(P)/FAD-dependent oxidoreductase n=1 Tax=unclassified Rathayibacter TaxID=2609250 RepID=UPI000F4C4042|nr:MULTISPECIES: FAD-binding oxidoreductase [unclassified Rathayibacter]ROP56989.1 glycine/D-amino acid oxidase-like deaminating enzyme [Rathayibacter sp. PhB186]ROS55374.1 glycine/D-amino acid oxidase-like deaminating enzyme [Rathayibacter sp. PhB185]